jgi:hypothetical protein
MLLYCPLVDLQYHSSKQLKWHRAVYRRRSFYLVHVIHVLDVDLRDVAEQKLFVDEE